MPAPREDHLWRSSRRVKPAQLDAMRASDKLKTMKVDLRKDMQLGHDLYCSIAFKAAADLRSALKLDEGAFRQIAPSLWHDPRLAFIYRVLDEVQKAGICIHDWFEKLKDEESAPDPADHMTRLASQWLQDEQNFRARKLAEVLVDLICFSATNDPEYYRDYFRLRDLDATVRSLNDQDEFFGFRRRNSEYGVDWAERDIIAAEAKLDVSKRWYLRNPALFQPTWKTRGVEFSSFRQRYIRSLELALPSELGALGKTYVHAYGSMSSEIHFTPQEISSDFDPNAVYLGIDRVGLLCFAILIRCQRLLGVVPDGLNSQLRKMHDENTGPSEIVGQLKQETAEVGDFVWAHGDICEVVEIRRSKFGYVSYLLRYIERPPIPEIKQDWFAGFEIHLVAKRSFAEEAMRSLQTDPNIDEETRTSFRDMPEEKREEMLGRAVARLWRGWQQVKASRAAKQ